VQLQLQLQKYTLQQKRFVLRGQCLECVEWGVKLYSIQSKLRVSWYGL